VAIKVLPDELSSDPGRLERFSREARAVAALNHPNILSVYDVGNEGGTPYAVFELLDGETLRGRLGRGPLPAGAWCTSAPGSSAVSCSIAPPTRKRC
jgi:serine/threonine protein kinase